MFWFCWEWENNWLCQSQSWIQPKLQALLDLYSFFVFTISHLKHQPHYHISIINHQFPNPTCFLWEVCWGKTGLSVSSGSALNEVSGHGGDVVVPREGTGSTSAIDLMFHTLLSEIDNQNWEMLEKRHCKYRNPCVSPQGGCLGKRGGGSIHRATWLIALSSLICSVIYKTEQMWWHKQCMWPLVLGNWKCTAVFIWSFSLTTKTLRTDLIFRLGSRVLPPTLYDNN